MILVTGASKGLGLAISERLIESGKEVLGIARDVSDLIFPSVACDVSNYDDVKGIARKLRKEKIRLDAVVNAAGIASMNLAVTTPSRVTEKVIMTNLAGTIYCCQLFSPLMVKRKAGAIINFSTIAVQLGLEGESVYVASKAGVEGFSKSFAKEMAPFNIFVNCIAPGPIDTALLRGVSNEQIQRIVERQVIRRKFKPSDVCDLVEILLDPRAKSLSGQILNIGGV